jgi:serine/threonine-protein kinase PknG
MADQLLGVLREIVAQEEGRPRPANSTWFNADTYEPLAESEAPDWRMLPTLKVDPDDTAAGLLATLPDSDAEELVRVLADAPMHTVEVQLRLARAQIDAGEAGDARKTLDAISGDDPWEWRVGWYAGLLAMSRRELPAARDAFGRVYDDVPGELAPKLALAMVAEMTGDLPVAARLYDVVSRTDSIFTTATYGLARVLAAMGDRNAAVAAYARVPRASSVYVDSQLRAARILVAHTAGTPPGASELAKAAATVNHLALDAEQRARTASQLLEAALELVQTGVVAPSGKIDIMGSPLDAQSLRRGLERAYRDLARLATTLDERIRLVDRANRVRPKTLV